MLCLKFYGPRIGALYVRSPGQKTPLYPMFYGGGQERSFRPGWVHATTLHVILCCYYRQKGAILLTDANWFHNSFSFLLFKISALYKSFTYLLTVKFGKAVIKYPATPHMHRYTSLWNVCARKLHDIELSEASSYSGLSHSKQFLRNIHPVVNLSGAGLPELSWKRGC